MAVLILNPIKMQLCPKGNLCRTSLISGQLPSQCGLKSYQNAPLHILLNLETLPLVPAIVRLFKVFEAQESHPLFPSLPLRDITHYASSAATS